MGGIEALLFGVLVLVLGTLVVANAWGVIDAKVAAAGAAREATRAFVQTPAGSDPATVAQAAAVRAIQGQGRERVADDAARDRRPHALFSGRRRGAVPGAADRRPHAREPGHRVHRRRSPLGAGRPLSKRAPSDRQLCDDWLTSRVGESGRKGRTAAS